MRTTRLLSLLFFTSLAVAASASVAEAAPSAEVTLDRYRMALASYKLDLDRQGVLFETLDGQQLLSYNIDCPFNPASVVKLATSDVALSTLGPNYRFPTTFFTNGTLDGASGTLVGDLVVLGSGDPSLTTEHSFYVANELRARGIRHVTGNIVVKGPLYCNYSMDRRAAGALLANAFEVGHWNGSIESAFGRYRVLTGQDMFESVIVDGTVVVDNNSSVTGLTPLFTLRSMPLYKILKLQNDFSNNWMAHVIGGYIGGVGTVERSVEDRLRIPPGEFFIDSTSGLGTNGMRPTDVVALLRDLRLRLAKDSLQPEAMMPVAGLDPGTLEDRFLQSGVRGAIVAKTGTLRGVSALAGYMHTRDRGIVLFAIMNQGGTPATFRRLQDDLVLDMFEACGGAAPIAYSTPVRYSGIAGTVIERAPGNIPETPRAVLAAEN
jgi:D-alanyl-D-alanine carboxypeptidase/D-alanyl-D-alanine-endopeptidase (penicillin-binding protein 4)